MRKGSFRGLLLFEVIFRIKWESNDVTGDMDIDGPDGSVWFEDGYPEKVQEFLLMRGAVEYLSFLSQEPRRFVEMQNQLIIGDGTLNQVHTRADMLHLREIGQQKRDGKYYRVHELSLVGEILVDRMQELGVTQRHERLRTVRNEYEHSKEEYLDWVEDPDGLVPSIERYVDMVASNTGTESSNSSSLDQLGKSDQPSTGEEQHDTGSVDSNEFMDG